MDLDSLLNASVALEKRIATDKLLRKYFAQLWKEPARSKLIPDHRPAPSAAADPKLRQLTFTFPSEMCELLALAAEATGKSPSEILEESFVEFYLKKIESKEKPPSS